MQKLRLQFYFSILGLDSSKGYDVFLDGLKQVVALQTDNDCKKTTFPHSLLPIGMLFNHFEYLTEYQGIED